LLVVILVVVMLVTKKKRDDEEAQGSPEPEDEATEEKEEEKKAEAEPSGEDGGEQSLPDPTADSEQEVLEPEIVTGDLPPELQEVHGLGAAPGRTPGPRRSTTGLAGPRRKGPVKKKASGDGPPELDSEPSALGLKMQEQFLLESGGPDSGELNAWDDPTKDSEGPDLDDDPDKNKEY